MMANTAKALVQRIDMAQEEAETLPIGTPDQRLDVALIPMFLWQMILDTTNELRKEL